jgi:hypothetical protein
VEQLLGAVRAKGYGADLLDAPQGVAGASPSAGGPASSFLINDAILIPLYLALLALGVRLLYASARSHRNLAPFWSGLGAALVAFVGLWIHAARVYASLAALIASSVWDFWNMRATRISSRELSMGGSCRSCSCRRSPRGGCWAGATATPGRLPLVCSAQAGTVKSGCR